MPLACSSRSRNSALGKDHWPVTTALVFGGGVRGGAIYGGTTADVQPVLVDLTTGKPSPTGKTITSSHFIGGVLAACGVDPTTHLGTPEILRGFLP